jgi:chitosanase
MRSKFVGTSKLAGMVAVLLLPLACGTAGGGDDDGPSVGTGGSQGSGGRGGSSSSTGGSPSAGGSHAGGASGSTGGAVGTASGGSGGPSGGSSDASPDTGGSPGSATGGAAGTPADAAPGDTGSTPPPPLTAGLNDPATCDFTDQAQFCTCINSTCGGDTFGDKMKALRSVYCGTCDATQTCIGTPSIAGGAAGSCKVLPGLTDGQKKKAAQLTSVWENSTPNIKYDYAQDIGDHRGYTNGRAGFCTGTGDAIIVIQCYVAAKPQNPMTTFLPELVKLEQKFFAAGGGEHFEDAKTGDTSGLPGWIAAWKASAKDPIFNKCQDAAVDAIYYGPALQKAAEKGFKAPLTINSLWDAQIMHGETGTIGVRALMATADSKVKLSKPPTDKEESDWLGAFHEARARIMNTRGEWKGNMYRVAVMERARRAGNMAFKGCINTGGIGAGAYWPGLPGGASSDVFDVCGD